MKKRNKAYKPREVLPVSLMFRHTADGALQLKLKPREAYQRLRIGTGTEQDLDTLACRLNWAFVAQRDFYANQAEDLAQDALDAIRAAKEVGRLGFSGLEMSAIGDGLDLADRMGDELTRKEQLRSFKTVVAWNNKAIKETA